MDEEIRSEALKNIPYGFFVVGVMDNSGEANGFTANWVSQASFDPPRVTVAVNKSIASHDMIRESRAFSLNFLDNSQEDLARKFARHQEAGSDEVGGSRFTPGPETNAPLFEEAFAHLECRVVSELDAGDHTVFLGEVVGAQLQRPADILTDLETPLEYGG
jgi:flavin reductase (DIM6/NTAB) family NADH-FMN oxidoreductase RutF